MSQYNTPGGGGQIPPPEPGQSPYQNPPNVPVPGPAVRESSEQAQEAQHTRTRVAVTVAALVATLGAVILGVVLTDGHGAKHTTGTSAAAGPHAVIDPPSSGVSGSASGGVLPTLTGIPPAAPAQDSASAMASAQAAGQAFTPPTSAPGNVPGYSASAPLSAVELPPFLTVTLPPVQAKDSGAQALADQSQLLLKAWAEAWATGNTNDARYRTLCADQCRTVLDSTITQWRKANILPAGTLRFFAFAGGLAKGNNQSGEVGVCLDDSALTAFRGGSTYQNPYPLNAPELLVFGLVYDKTVGHWVATEAYTSPGDSYCTSQNGDGTTS